MPNEDLSKETSINLPTGHLLVVWYILSNKLSCSPIVDEFSEEEKRAIWALEDLCEEELIRNGITGKHEKEWSQFVERAAEFVKTVPAKYLD